VGDRRVVEGRPIGVLCKEAFEQVMGEVAIQPGATLFTVMPRPATSIATDFTNEIMAPLDAA
jgi:hypothetical protein